MSGIGLGDLLVHLNRVLVKESHTGNDAFGQGRVRTSSSWACINVCGGRGFVVLFTVLSLPYVSPVGCWEEIAVLISFAR